LEGVPGWENDAAHYAQLCSEWADVMAAALQDHARFDRGIRIEAKPIRCRYIIAWRAIMRRRINNWPICLLNCCRECG